jgi:hypothetical protein
VFPSLHVFGKVLRKGEKSLNACYDSSMKPSGPGFFFFGRFLVTDLTSLLVLDLFRYLFLHKLALVGFVFLGICPFYPICLCIVVSYNCFVSKKSVMSQFSFLTLII